MDPKKSYAALLAPDLSDGEAWYTKLLGRLRVFGPRRSDAFPQSRKRRPRRHVPVRG